jgi:hypothetical protein
MNRLTVREIAIVCATLKLWNVNLRLKHVPDYELWDADLTADDMRDVRDIVQRVDQEVKKLNNLSKA